MSTMVHSYDKEVLNFLQELGVDTSNTRKTIIVIEAGCAVRVITTSNIKTIPKFEHYKLTKEEINGR